MAPFDGGQGPEVSVAPYMDGRIGQIEGPYLQLKTAKKLNQH